VRLALPGELERLEQVRQELGVDRDFPRGFAGVPVRLPARHRNAAAPPVYVHPFEAQNLARGTHAAVSA
jgi:hypothetical protein